MSSNPSEVATATKSMLPTLNSPQLVLLKAGTIKGALLPTDGFKHFR